MGKATKLFVSEFVENILTILFRYSCGNSLLPCVCHEEVFQMKSGMLYLLQFFNFPVEPFCPIAYLNILKKCASKSKI